MGKIKIHTIVPLVFFFGITYMYLFTPIAIGQSDNCSRYTGSYTPPANFGSATNVFSTSRELILRTTCLFLDQLGYYGYNFIVTEPKTNIQAFAVYRTGYFWIGGQWTAYALKATDDVKTSGDFIMGNAQAEIRFSTDGKIPENITPSQYWVAYTCSYVSNTWKCGCRDSACTSRYWQLQGYVAPPVGPVSNNYSRKDYLGTIMPLGDSITQGGAQNYTYRYYLWEKLAQDNARFDFVGSQSSHYNGTPTFPNSNFDRNHEGHWGWRADQIETLISTLEGNIDIVLLHIGTNDILQGQSVESTAQEIKNIITTIRNKSPYTDIAVAKIIPVANNATANERIQELNLRIEQIVRSMEVGQAKQTVVDQWSGFDASTDTYDGVHPNEQGERKMAEKWFQAIRGWVNAM